MRVLCGLFKLPPYWIRRSLLAISPAGLSCCTLLPSHGHLNKYKP